MGQTETTVGSFSYLGKTTPENYVCSTCGAAGCKLWRPFNVLPVSENLQCATCASQGENDDVSAMSVDGRHVNSWKSNTDLIGSLAPAIPFDKGGSYWGYTSSPPQAIAWWRSLPNAPIDQ